jgi:hypothetical protein
MRERGDCVRSGVVLAIVAHITQFEFEGEGQWSQFELKNSCRYRTKHIRTRQNKLKHIRTRQNNVFGLIRSASIISI